MASSGELSGSKRSPDGTASTSRSLLVRLRDNESNAWDRLVALYAPLVCFWCRKLGIAEQDISDVVQDVFKSVMTGLEKFHKVRPEDTFRGWLRTITRSRAADHFRSKSRQANAVGGSEAMRLMDKLPDSVFSLSLDESDEETVYHSLFLRACEIIRSDFQENTWKAFWRVVVDGCSPTEVAEELSMRPGTVRVAKSRVLQRLRQEMGEMLH